MVKYRVIFGYFSEIVELEEETTDFQAITDICIDQLEENGSTGCFINREDTVEEGGEHYEDEYVCGGTHGLLLHHGGNFRIEKLEGEE